uniref:Uncharacterized protein n=1 Tax=Lepeophtheirus salmonis TaxID=72036 RepID=A0A0K2U8D8_LEPSM
MIILTDDPLHPPPQVKTKDLGYWRANRMEVKNPAHFVLKTLGQSWPYDEGVKSCWNVYGLPSVTSFIHGMTTPLRASLQTSFVTFWSSLKKWRHNLYLCTGP